MSNRQSSPKMAPKGLGCGRVTFRPKVCGQITKHVRLLSAFAPSLLGYPGMGHPSWPPADNIASLPWETGGPRYRQAGRIESILTGSEDCLETRWPDHTQRAWHFIWRGLVVKLGVGTSGHRHPGLRVERRSHYSLGRFTAFPGDNLGPGTLPEMSSHWW